MEGPMTRTLKRRIPISEDFMLSKSITKKKKRFTTTEETVTMQIFAVSIQNGPLEFSLYEYTFRGLKYIYKHLKEIFSDIPEVDDNIIVIHHNENDIEDLFKGWLGLSQAFAKRQTKLDNETELKSPKVILCYLDEAFWRDDKVTCQSVREILKTCPPQRLLFILRGSKSERKMIDIVKGLKKGINANQILFPSCNIKKSLTEKCYEIQEEMVSTFTAHIEEKAKTRQAMKYVKTLKSFLENILQRKSPKRTVSQLCLRNLKSAVGNSILGYRVKGGTLEIFSRNMQDDNEEIKGKLTRIRATYGGEIKIVILSPPYINAHCSISCGSELLRNLERRGTLGMFAKITEGNKIVALSSGHVVQAEMEAYVKRKGSMLILGKCIWPFSDSHDESNCSAHIPDISVIIVEKEIIRFVNLSKLKKKVYMYDKPLSDLKFRQVFKVGASTAETRGHVKPCELFHLFKTDVMTVEPDFGLDNFSLPGDSGAIVLTEIEDKLYAVGVVLGGDLTTDASVDDRKDSIVISLQNAIQRFNRYGQSGKLQVDVI